MATITYTYQFERDDGDIAGASGTAVLSSPGSISELYTPVAGDIGHSIRFRANDGTTTFYSTWSGPIIAHVDNPGIGSFRLGASYPYGTNYDKMHSLVVSVGDSDAAAAVPNVLALEYCSGVQVEHNVFDRNIGAFVDIAVARANGWLLHKGGKELYYSGGTTSLADPSNVAFQNEWATECIAYLNAHGMDGVHIDNFEIDLLNFNASLEGTGTFSYPTDEAAGANQSAWANAQIAFIANVGPKLKAAGKYVLVNGAAFIGGDGRSDTGDLSKLWMDRYAAYVSAMEVEYWQQNPNNTTQMRNSGDPGTTPYPYWEGWQSVHAYALSKGIGFHGLVYGNAADLQRCRYGRASWLMEWDGALGEFNWAPDGSNADNWNSVIALAVGTPTSAKTQLATGVFKRTYTGKTVYVNSTLATVSADGHSIPALDGLFV